MKTTVFLVRHGETQWTVEDRFNGHTDMSLTDYGRSQAKHLALRLGEESIIAAYCSPLRRCVETATLVAEPHIITPIIRDGLVELDYGAWDGMPRQEIAVQYPDEWTAWVKDPAVVAPPQGETGYAALTRSVAVLREIVVQHVGQAILVVAHKAINRLLLCEILGIPPRNYRSRIEQFACALNCIEWHNDEPLVTLVNDTSHYSQTT